MAVAVAIGGTAADVAVADSWEADDEKEAPAPVPDAPAEVELNRSSSEWIDSNNKLFPLIQKLAFKSPNNPLTVIVLPV